MKGKDDGPAPITDGLRGGPLPGATRKLPLPKYWRQVVDEAVEARGGIARMAPSLFNKHVTEMLQRYSDEEIRRGFRLFAKDVRDGTVDVQGKTAWLVFFGRRERWCYKAEQRKLQFNDHPQPRMRLGATKEEPPG